MKRLYLFCCEVFTIIRSCQETVSIFVWIIIELINVSYTVDACKVLKNAWIKCYSVLHCIFDSPTVLMVVLRLGSPVYNIPFPSIIHINMSIVWKHHTFLSTISVIVMSDKKVSACVDQWYLCWNCFK